MLAQKGNLLVGMSGSIGMMNMPTILQALKPVFPDMRVVMTRSAKEFVPEATIALVAGSVYSELFPLGATPRDRCHVESARWADLIAVLPASANLIAQVAHGMSSSLLSSTILCSERPVIFFPNMNKAMWDNPATRRNVALIEEYGHRVIEPQQQVGFEYATGAMKEGLFMPPPHEILEILQDQLHKRSDEAILDESWIER